MPTEAKPWQKRMRWYYRGPDVVGTHLSHHPLDSPAGFAIEYFVSLSVNDQYDHGLPFTLPAATVKIARHRPVVGHGGGARPISSVEDLASLDPENPPDRIETLATLTVPPLPNCTIVPPAVAEFTRREIIASNAVPLNMFAGPQLVAIEIISPWSIGISTRFRVSAHLIHTEEVDADDPGTWNLKVRAL